MMLVPRLMAQTSNPPIRTRGINHVTLQVSDLKRSVDFYQGLFGMPIINRQAMSAGLQIGTGPQHLGLSLAGTEAPNINHVCLNVENFNVDRIVGILTQRGFTKSEDPGPMKVRVRMRDATPELYFYDADSIAIQLQDPKYCGGSGPLGNVCPAPEPSPKKGLMALRGWSHCTIFGSDATQSNKFYQDLFGSRVQGYQAPAGSTNSPFLSAGNGVEFLMFGGGGGGARGGAANAAPRRGSINHLCMSMDNFNPDTVIKNLESYGIKPRGNPQGAAGPLVHYISLRMENRGGAKDGTPELYFTDPDGLLIQLQDTKYCGGAGFLGDVCPA